MNMAWKNESHRHSNARKGIKTNHLKPVIEPNHKTRTVLDLMYQEKVDPEYASPNFVAEFAYNRGIHLTSDEVVYISDNYN